MELYELLMIEISKCNVNLLKRYFMGILDRAATLEFGEFTKVCDTAISVNSEWYKEWVKEN